MKADKDKAKMQENTEPAMDINTDESLSGSTHLNEPVATEPEIEAIRSELSEMKDKYLRTVAEFDNFRKRSNKEKYELIRTAGKDVITDLLEVLDDVDRAEKQMNSATEIEEIKEGISLVFSKLRTKLAARGLKQMEVINVDFDADLHDAITEIEVPSKDQKGKIVDEIQKGYYLNEAIIRHAKVVVGK